MFHLKPLITPMYVGTCEFTCVEFNWLPTKPGWVGSHAWIETHVWLFKKCLVPLAVLMIGRLKGSSYQLSPAKQVLSGKRPLHPRDQPNHSIPLIQGEPEWEYGWLVHRCVSNYYLNIYLLDSKFSIRI